MKRKDTFKSLLLAACLLSLCAFAFVNTQTHSSIARSFDRLEVVNSEVQCEEERESGNLSVPDVSVLGRVWEIAQRFLQRTQ